MQTILERSEVLELLGADGQQERAFPATAAVSAASANESTSRVPRRRLPVGPLIADIRDPQPTADVMGQTRDAHGERVGGVEDQVGLALRQGSLSGSPP